ncbi:MAG TPA: S1C family serine protease, partial [Pirellulaceae bacterium]|nr:S1C family serine protease [Pirellulaceae bacterium]
RVAAWKDWEVAPASGGTLAEAGLEISLVRDERRPPPGEILAAVQVKNRPLVLRRELAIGPHDNWLVIAATRPFSRGQEPKVEVKIGGEPVAEFAVPEWQTDPNDSRPLAVSLAGYRQAAAERTVNVEVIQQSAVDSAPVLYRSITTIDELPTLHRVLEEQALPVPIAANQAGGASLTSEDRYYGKNSLKVSPGGQFRLELARTIAIRERPKWGEARFIRFAVRKQSGGRFALELAGPQPRDPPARYDLGRGEPSYGSATRIWQDNLPKDWVAITRDLFADFGSLDVNAVVVGSPDNGDALVDHIYLARGPQDFDLIPAAPSVELVNDKARRELAAPLIEKNSPATVRIEFTDGRQAAGVLISPQGEILTAGHAVIGANRDCRVTLSDGTTAAARTLGVARDFDLGLVRITPDGNYPIIPPHTPADLPQNQVYLAFTYPPRVQEFRRGDPYLVQIRRLFRSTVWIDLTADDWIAGGPLIDRDGRLVAIQVAKSQFGGVLCTRFQEPWQHLPRLRNGEVFGAWPPGSEPATGFAVAAAEGAVTVKSVAAASSAEKAGLQVGDLIQKVDAQPTASEADVQRAIAAHDAGQEVALDLTRGGMALQVRFVLTPRVP